MSLGWSLPTATTERALFRGLRGDARALRAPAVQERLRGERLSSWGGADRGRGLALAAMMADLVTDLGEGLGSTPHLFFKGALTDPLFFGGQGRRGACDVDVLVAPHHEDKASTVLTALGYRQVVLGGWHQSGKERTWRAPGRPEVDLHVGVFNPHAFVDPTLELLVRRRRFETEWGPIYGPAPEDMILIAAGNLAGDRGNGRVKLALDSAAIIERYDLDWERVLERAKRAGCRTGLWSLLRVLERSLEVTLPEGVVSACAPDAARRLWIERVLGLRDGPRALRGSLAPALLLDWPLSDSPLYPVRFFTRYARAFVDDGPLELTVRGTCMEPVIEDGQATTVVAKARPPLPGDVVTIATPRGLLMHRALGVLPLPGHGWRIITQADNALAPDAPAPLEDLVGFARVEVRRRDRVHALARLSRYCARAALRKLHD